jgi:hypothetical protein
MYEPTVESSSSSERRSATDGSHPIARPIPLDVELPRPDTAIASRNRYGESSPYADRMATVDRLGDEIAVLAAQIQAATYELLVRLRDFDQREGWFHHGAKSCAHWLAWRTSLDPGAAREWVRVARALEHLPLLSEAMRKGEISYSKVRALTRIATPETERPLVELARAGTAAHVERIVRACRRYGPREEQEEESRLHACRYVHVSRDEDGMFILRARLEPVAGAVIVRALDAAAEKLYGEKREKAGSETASETPECGSGSAELGAAASEAPPTRDRSVCRDAAGNELAPSQRRADALALVAEAALAAGLDPGTRGDRYQVVVHVDAPVLADPAEQGVSALAEGQHVSAETSRRVACDAATVVMTHAPDGSALDVGRRTRTISPALRRALVMRDNGCRFPGCGLRLCDAHHVKHWAEGGETSLANTVLLCRFHHRLVHEEGFTLALRADGDVEFRRPDGRLLPAAPLPPPCPIDPVEALIKRLEDGAIVVDPYAARRRGTGGRGISAEQSIGS